VTNTETVTRRHLTSANDAPEGHPNWGHSESRTGPIQRAPSSRWTPSESPRPADTPPASGKVSSLPTACVIRKPLCRTNSHMIVDTWPRWSPRRGNGSRSPQLTLTSDLFEIAADVALHRRDLGPLRWGGVRAGQAAGQRSHTPPDEQLPARGAPAQARRRRDRARADAVHCGLPVV